MRKLTALLFLLTTYSYSQNYVNVPVENTYVPFGFDSNDYSEVVIHGWLPNDCYRFPTASYQINGSFIDINVGAYYFAPQGEACLMVIDPYTLTVKLGVLPSGHYQIRVNANTDFEHYSKINILESPNEHVDQHKYAKVEIIEPVIGQRAVLIKGYNPSPCFELKAINIIPNGVDTYSILPIMRLNLHGGDYCPAKMQKFEYYVEIPTEIQRDNVLLHVRSMGGRSQNFIYNAELSWQYP